MIPFFRKPISIKKFIAYGLAFNILSIIYLGVIEKSIIPMLIISFILFSILVAILGLAYFKIVLYKEYYNYLLAFTILSIILLSKEATLLYDSFVVSLHVANKNFNIDDVWEKYKLVKH